MAAFSWPLILCKSIFFEVPFIERDAVQLSFTLQEQIASVSSLFKRYENVPASLADAALIRMAEIHDSPLLLTTDSDFHIYRRHGRQTIPLVCP
jgi:predicted nucleic acid-binding protein